MNICTLKISLLGDKLIAKINDQYEYKKSNKSKYVHLYFNEIFSKEILQKITSSKSYIYFRYNVRNLNLQFKTANIYYKRINNKTLLANLLINKDESSLTIDSLDIDDKSEINIMIRIITISLIRSSLKTHNDWYSRKNELDKVIYQVDRKLCILIKLQNPNTFFSLVKVDDYDKKIKSIKLPLYDMQMTNDADKCNYIKTNYTIVFDLYPTNTSNYMLLSSEIINQSNNNSYKLILDKECKKCLNRINGCELNSISKVLLCCDCYAEIIKKDLHRFFECEKNDYFDIVIKLEDFPSYIKENFYCSYQSLCI